MGQSYAECEPYDYGRWLRSSSAEDILGSVSNPPLPYFLAMHENLVAQAVLPMPGIILGLDMMPYSLGCELQLFKIESPWLLLEREAFDKMSFEDQLAALIQAVNICCKRRSRWPRLWGWMYRPRTAEALALPIAEFRNYLMDGRLQFRANLCAQEDMHVRYLGEPEILRLYRFINATVPRPEIELYGKSAWDFPYSFAKMLCQGDAEEKGGIEIYNIKSATHDDYHRRCEEGRTAWMMCENGDDRRKALSKHPIIRELAGLEEEARGFEHQTFNNKDSSCPVSS